MTTNSTIKINIDDVVEHGSVEAALLAYCEESMDTAGGVIGSSFATSGPGAGWSIQFNAQDYAARALSEEYGALYYLDVEDGRLASRDEDSDPEDEVVNWTDESVVCLECPDADDALVHPQAFADMAKAAFKVHSAKSNLDGWRVLIKAIRATAEMIEDVDVD